MSTICCWKMRGIFRLNVMILIPCKRVILCLKCLKKGCQVFQWSYFTKQQIQSENGFESKNEIKSKCLVNLTIPFYIITNS